MFNFEVRTRVTWHLNIEYWILKIRYCFMQVLYTNPE